MKKVAVIVPIYKQKLDVLEDLSLKHSLNILYKREKYFICPKNLDTSYYREQYDLTSYIEFDETYFNSLIAYSDLMMSRSFYERFSSYDFILILQTDAIILNDDLDYWMNEPYDYIGAPWPDGIHIKINISRFLFHRKKFTFYVGNGGLSLRRVNKILLIIDELENVKQKLVKKGYLEDFFFGLAGSLSKDFKIPNQAVASRFSLELKPSYFFKLNGGNLPMGGHAWWKHEPEFWREHIPFKF